MSRTLRTAALVTVLAIILAVLTTTKYTALHSSITDSGACTATTPDAAALTRLCQDIDPGYRPADQFTRWWVPQ